MICLPFRTQTTLKEGVQLPPPDYLMCKLIEMVNVENPPCANCDKRDPSSMYFCSTCGKYTLVRGTHPRIVAEKKQILIGWVCVCLCKWLIGQALCKPCRENTHRAKMFSSHDIVQMSKRLADKTEIVSELTTK